MEKFIESLDEFRSNNKIVEASDTAEFNRKLADTIDKAKTAKDNAIDAKEKYEKLVKDKNQGDEVEIAFLKYKKFKGQQDMLEATVRLMRLEKPSGDKGDVKKEVKKEIEKTEDKKTEKKDGE